MIIIGAVLARGNSKGIKNKNLLKFENKTLVGRAVNQAYQSKFIKKVYISSDSLNIIKEAKKYNAIEPFKRPKSLSLDTTPHIHVWRHLVRHLKKKKIHADYIVDIPTTSPLRNINDINRCVKLAMDKKLDMVFTLTKSSKNPYFNMLEKKGKKFQLIKNLKKKISRRQGAPQCYDLTTVCYVFKPSYIMQTKDVLSGKVGFIDIPKERAIDIDDKIDYKIALMLSKKK
jgi:CMP-N-acetylneuraminic acid synthetase